MQLKEYQNNGQNKAIYDSALVFLWCFFIQLFNFPNKLAVLLGILFCAVIVWKSRISVEYVRKLLLITAFLSYSIIVGKDRNTILMYAVFPVTFFFLGESVTKAFPEEKYRTGVLAAVVGGYTVHGILNSCIFFRDGISGVRGWADIWYQTFSPATQQIIFYLPIMALMFVSLYMVKKKTVPCLCLIAGNLFFLYVSFASLSRGSIVIWALVLPMEGILYLLLNHKQHEKFLNKKVLFCLVGIGVLALAAWEILMHSSYASVLTRDGGILNNIRFKGQICAIRQLFTYPMGGYQMYLAGMQYAHNIWLDTANAAGLIPFTALVLYTLLSVYDLMKLLFKTNISQEIKYAMSGIYVAFFLYYMIEPALEANILFLIPWIFLNGVIYGCLYKKGEEQR